MQLDIHTANKIIAATETESLNVTAKTREAATELAQNAARELLTGMDMPDLDRVMSHFGYWVERGENHFGNRDYPIWMVSRRDYSPLREHFEDPSFAYTAAIDDLLEGTSGAWILTEVVDGGLVD